MVSDEELIGGSYINAGWTKLKWILPVVSEEDDCVQRAALKCAAMRHEFSEER